MAFLQTGLSRILDQSKGIFDKFIYRTDTDTLAEVKADGYFDYETFGYRGPQSDTFVIDVMAADGYEVLKLDVATSTTTVLLYSEISAGQVQTSSASDAERMAESNTYPVGTKFSTFSYYDGLNIGGNVYELKDAGDSAARLSTVGSVLLDEYGEPDLDENEAEQIGADGFEIIFIGDDGLYLEALFPDNIRTLGQYGGIPDHVEGATDSTNNMRAFRQLCKGKGAKHIEPVADDVDGYFVDYDRGFLTNVDGYFVREDGEKYGQGEGNKEEIEALIEVVFSWYNDADGAVITGTRGKSNIYCGEQVITLMAATGLTINGVSFDGGFDPTQKDMILKPLLVMNQNTKFLNGKISNTYGSCMFSKFGPHLSDDVEYGPYGDHAFYTTSETVRDGIGVDETVDIAFQNATVTQDPSYSNRPEFYGGREAVKARDLYKTNLKVSNINATGVQVILTVDTSDSTINSGNIAQHIDVQDVTATVDTNDYDDGSGDTLNQNFIKLNASNISGTIANNTVNAINGNRGSAIDNQGANDGIVITDNVFSGFSDGIVNNYAGADGLKNANISRNNIDGGYSAIRNAGESAKIHGNTCTNQTDIGIQDIWGNDVFDNEISTAVAKGIFVNKNASAGDVVFRCVKNRVSDADFGVHHNGFDSGDRLVVTDNEYTDCITHSHFSSATSDTALAEGTFERNIVKSGPAFSNDLVQGAKFNILSALPTATEAYRGKTCFVDAAGIDTMYVCLQTSTGVFAWVAK